MAKDPREYGYEGEMAMSQLKAIMMHAEQLHDMMEPDTDLPEWVQSKITLAYDYIQTAADYMSTEMSEEVKAGKAYKVPVKPPQPWSGGKVYKQKPVDSKISTSSSTTYKLSTTDKVMFQCTNLLRHSGKGRC